ncbi:MAG: HEAT repeat domain-containing protein [Planctomycetota bacterium]
MATDDRSDGLQIPATPRQGTEQEDVANLPELPAVSPPSTSFFVQLFLVPALIVFGIMLVWFLFGKIAGSNRSAEEYLAIIQSDRQDRWKAAHDLSYLLQEGSAHRKDKELALRISNALQQGLSAKPPADPQYLEYMAGAVGKFDLPTGAAALRLAAKPDQPTPVRRAALLSLADLAFRISDLQDPNVLLDVRDYLSDENVEIRELAAFTLGQLKDPKATDALIKSLSDPVPTVRYNAACSLASLKSDAAMAVYVEMLNEQDLAKSFVLSDQGKEFVDQRVVLATLQSALRSLQKVQEAVPNADFSRVLPSVKALENSENPAVRHLAKELLLKLDARSKSPS